MDLAQSPFNLAVRIEALGLRVRNLSYYITAGLRPGSTVRVLARYPERQPRFAEIELESSLVITLPLAIAREVCVSAV